MHFPSRACKLGHIRTGWVHKLYHSAASGESPVKPAMPGLARLRALLRESTPEPHSPKRDPAIG
jgi:hypothetical protein